MSYSSRFTKVISLPILGFGLMLATPAKAQMSCVDAAIQLQQYAGQVNQVANYWYYQGIAQSCYGNPMCANAMLQQLNYWYQQQAARVNQWYYQISYQCNGSRPSPSDLPGRGARAGSQGIDEDAIEELEADADEEKTVAIVIPDNPRGFRPRR